VLIRRFGTCRRSISSGSTPRDPQSKTIHESRSTPNLFGMYFLDYDDMGNIFVDGTNVSGAFQYAELPKGAKAFKDIALNQTITVPGGVQYTHGQVAVADSVGDVIYQTSGATITGSTQLEAGRVEQFYVQGENVINPDFADKQIEVFNYPAGGRMTKLIATGLSEPVGAVISK
jgi:hypothetical protein